MIIYLNGKYIPIAEASLQLNERGFLFGDGLYEVLLCYNGYPFCLNEHLGRLTRGCRFIRLNLDDLGFIGEVCDTLVEMNNFKDCTASLYIQITRGTAPRSHKFPPPDTAQTVYISAKAFEPDRGDQKNGISVMLCEDIRWDRCDIKTIDLLPNVLAHQNAFDSGCGEAIFVKNDTLLEGTHSNFFAVINGVLTTHPLTNKILPGITRMKVLEICRKNNITVLENPIGMEMLGSIEEAFISSTTLEITPVVKIDDTVISEGNPGKLTRVIQDEYQKMIGELSDGI